MGGCCSTDAYQYALNGELLVDNFKWRHQAVLFGLSGSGKSTICKKIDFLFNKYKIQNYNNCTLIQQIRQNCVDHMIALCYIANDMETIKLLNTLSIDKDTDLSKISNIISSVWKQQTIKIKYALRYFYYNSDEKVDDCGSDFVFDENMEYFFDQIEQIMDPTFIPNTQHFLKHKTSNYKTIAISISPPDKEGKIVFIDLGNFQCESQIYYKQLPMFEYYPEVSFFLFVVALPDFCIYDPITNKSIIFESIKYFKFLRNSNWLKHQYTILIFNKSDIFAECIKYGHSMKRCFEDFDGNEYFNLKLLDIVSFLCRNIQNKISQQIPAMVENIIKNYLVVATEIDNKTYFDICYQESLKFIMNKYLEIVWSGYGEKEELCTFVINAMNDYDINNLIKTMIKRMHQGGYIESVPQLGEATEKTPCLCQSNMNH